MTGLADRAGSDRMRDHFLTGLGGRGWGGEQSMGLDVWVVKMEHVDSPTGLLKDFLFDVAESLDWDYDGWGGGWEGNAFIEVFKEDLGGRAWDYAWERGLPREEGDKVVEWVRKLPWEDGALSLNVNW